MDNIKKIMSLFETERNKEQAVPMENYMKNNFHFLGIKTPMRTKLMRAFYKETGILKETFHHDFVLDLWSKDEREYQYAALDYIGRSLNKLDSSDIQLMEELIIKKSWWDTIDGIAPHGVAEIAAVSPEVIPNTIDKWSTSENIWLQRSAILFQLKSKEKTDETLLFRYIRQNAASKEFFVQKAIGWALREYSKTNPTSVKQFIDENELAKLSIREGSKYI